MHDNLYMCMSATSDNGVCHTEIGLCISVSAVHQFLINYLLIRTSVTSAEMHLNSNYLRIVM